MSSTANETRQQTRQELDDEILQRLTQWQTAHPDGNGPRDPVLESKIYEFLYRELPGVAMLLHGLGWKANNPKADVSCRFTSVLNKAFLRILERYPTELMKKRSLKHLRGYVSRAMSRMMINHYRRKQTFRRIVESFLGMSTADQKQANRVLAQIVQEKSGYFEERTGATFDVGLQQIEAWENSTDPGDQARATVLQLRYFDGRGYDDIAGAMGISRNEVENLLEQAKYHLRKLK